MAITVIAVAIFAWWLVAGDQLVSLVDRFDTVQVGQPLTPSWFAFDEGNDATAEEPTLSFTGRRRIIPRDWRIVERPTGDVSLETVGGTLVLGVPTRVVMKDHTAQSYEIAPDQGDVVILTRRRSRLAWPRPFAVDWLGGHTPRWSRYTYDELVWRKPGGTVLDAVWRDEQRLTPNGEWVDQYLPALPIVKLRPDNP